MCTQILYISYILLAILILNSTSYNTKIVEDQVWSEYVLFNPNKAEFYESSFFWGRGSILFSQIRPLPRKFEV